MLTPQEVSTHAFTKAPLGGYNMAMVDEFLDELTDDYTALYKENAALKAKLKVLVEKVEEYRSTEDAMRATLLTAQKMADSIVHEAEAKRDEILAQAQSDAQEKIENYRRELSEAYLKELCAATLDCLRDYPGPYCIESFDPRVVRIIRRTAPGVLRGQLVDCYQGYRGESAAALHAYGISHCLCN